MSNLEGRVQEMEATIEHMIKQIDELYELQKISANPFMIYLLGTEVKHRNRVQ